MKDSINILFTGDFFPGGENSLLIKEKRYNDIFNDFLPIIQNCDIAVTNLECPLTDSDTKIEKTGPTLKAGPETIQALKFAGFNLLTLANNHIMDYGFRGLKDTINLCKENQIDYCGAGINYSKASKILYKIVRQKKIAFICLAENEFSTTFSDGPGANPLDIVSNYYMIKEARKNADYVFVIVHGGHEMYSLPSPRMKKTYRFFIDTGADVVVGHHPHVISGYERYKDGIIFYSLGNFIFEKTMDELSPWHIGFGVKFVITESNFDFNIIPFKQGYTKAGLELLINKKLNDFNDNIENLNPIIADDRLLKKHFMEFVTQSKSTYNNFLEPIQNRTLSFLRLKGMVPSLLSKRKRLLYLNLIRCESHRDVLINVLKYEDSHTRR